MAARPRPVPGPRHVEPSGGVLRHIGGAVVNAANGPRYPDYVKTFDTLFAELSEKAKTRPEGSRTIAELDSGVHGIGKKVVEEAAEVWMAAEYETNEAAAEEISQLLYHLQVMMLAKGLTLQDVYKHL